LRRAGGLLCLARLLGASDLHAGNLIGASGGPFLVDAETLLQPAGPLGIRGPVELDPFARTQLLFATQSDAAGGPYDFGGLTGGGGAVGELRRPVWRHANTDAMHVETATALLPEPGNQPTVDGRRLSPDDDPAAFLDGYERAYRVLLEHGDELLADDGPLAGASGASTRVIPRPSQTYGTVLARLRDKRYQGSGAAGDLLVEALNRAFHPFLWKHPVWGLAALERRSLRDLDVPAFRLGVDETSFPLGPDRSTGPCFRHSGWGALQRRIAGLSPGELEQHLQHLRGVLEPVAPAVRIQRPPAPGTWELVASARAVGDEIATRAGKGGTAWLLPDDAPPGAPLSLDLYDGAIGTALFLALLARAVDDDRYRDLARRACAPVLEGLVEPDRPFDAHGACHGLGGIVYGLVVVARALDDDSLLAAAENAARRIEPERLRGDRVLDVSGGAAGALLGLLALRPHRAGSWLDERLAAARERLVETAHPHRNGVAWPTAAGDAHGGLAHGASGICMALDRLAGSDDPGLGELVDAGFRGEAMADQARSLGPELGFSWCHGVAGAGIARAIVLADRRESGEEPDSLAAAIDTASRATLQSGLSTVDHLCCGNGGRIELLLQAAHVGSDPWLLSMAREGARRLAGRRRQGAGFRLRSDGPESPYDPGLFRGSAGVGLELLRVALPDDVHAVLAFEAPA
jgi:type 2 lantibiotic biosynthesis protein LanM